MSDGICLTCGEQTDEFGSSGLFKKYCDKRCSDAAPERLKKKRIYNKSAAGKARQKRYNGSDLYKLNRSRYRSERRKRDPIFRAKLNAAKRKPSAKATRNKRERFNRHHTREQRLIINEFWRAYHTYYFRPSTTRTANGHYYDPVKHRAKYVANREAIIARTREEYKKATAELSDAFIRKYICKELRKVCGSRILSCKQIPAELVVAKRAQLLLYREANRSKLSYA